jgi:hypothetical protein
MVVGVVEKTDAVFNVKDEVLTISKDTSARDVEIYSNEKISDLTLKLNEKTANYDAAVIEIAELKNALASYEREKEQFIAQKHKEMIETIIFSKRDEMGKFSEYLEYCLEMDAHFAKERDVVEKEIKDIHYNYLNRNNPNNKQTFEAINTAITGTNADTSEDTFVERYGEENVKYFQ